MTGSLLFRILRLFASPRGTITRAELFFAAVVIGLSVAWIARFGQLDIDIGPKARFDDIGLLKLLAAALIAAVSGLIVIMKRLRDLGYDGMHSLWIALLVIAALFPGQGLPAWQFAAMCIAGLIFAWLLVTPTAVSVRFYEGRMA